MKNQTMQSYFGILGFLFLSICGISTLNAQCSEAENADMKKYMELTKTQDAQGCSQCAWLANLYCIAENGLFENDRSELEKTIAATKQNIQYMGDPICCPELLTKSIRWGSPSSAAAGSSDGVGSSSENKIVDEIVHVVGGLSNMLDNVSASNSLDEEFDALKAIMTANSVLADVDPMTGQAVDYSSEDKINAQYDKQKAVIDKHAPRLYEVNQAIMNIKDNNVDIQNSLYSDGFGLLNKIGSTIDVLGSDSVIKKEIESMMVSLNASKQSRMFELFKSGVKAEVLVTNSVVEELINRNKGMNDYVKFQSNTVVAGWTPETKYGAFRKLIPDFKIKTFNNFGFTNRVGKTDYYFSIYKKLKIGLVAKMNTETAAFNGETLTRFQEKALQILEDFINKTGVEVFEFLLINDKPYDISLAIITTDYTTKFTSLSIAITSNNSEELNFSQLVMDHSLTNEYWKNQASPYQDMVDKILANKK